MQQIQVFRKPVSGRDLWRYRKQAEFSPGNAVEADFGPLSAKK
jgi:hypothetical protein